MKFSVLVLSCVLPLAACVISAPDNSGEVGAAPGTSDFDRAQRDAALNGGIRTSPGIVTPNAARTLPLPDRPSAAPAGSPVIASSDLQNAGIGTRGADPLRTEGVQAQPRPTSDVQIASTGISDEQDFDTVSGNRDIEDDADLRARQQAAYQVIQPEALPERGEAGPNIIEYALNAPNRRGQEWYSRSILSGQGRFERNCASYRSADEAQRDFLTRGGPERDPRGIDPDGDGFACGWDPAPFRAAGRN